MFVTKHTVTNFLIFATCLTTCLILFSLENKQSYFKEPQLKKSSSLYPNSLKLFDLNFQYLINNDVCEDGIDINAVIIVTSYYGHTETRSAMRRAFSNEELKKFKLRRVFLLAVGPQHRNYDVSYNAILHENTRFSDLIQGNFREAYRNLTYKHIMGLNWATTYCSNAKYVIKMDDDIVFNMYKILDLIHNLKLPDKNPLAGYILNGMVPIREPANKWYVTKQEYQKNMYPPFVSGWFYITTPKVAGKLVHLSEQTPYFWIDDVYVTGILAKQLKIKHYNLNKIYAVHSEYLECCVRDLKVHNYDCDLLIGPNGGDNNMFFTFNNVMSKCLNRKCIARPEGYDINSTCVAERKTRIGKGKAIIETIHLF